MNALRRCPSPAVAAFLFLAGLSLSAAESAKPEPFEARLRAVREIRRSDPVNWAEFEKAARALQRDFPSERDAHDPMFSLMNHYQPINDRKARQLAEEMIASPAPEAFRLRAKGVMNRIDLAGKPVPLRFTAVDGRVVDLAQFKGKVVLIDFWASWCRPCIVSLPKVKQAYEKFHSSGFEIIGISCDDSRQALETFVNRNGMPWPQYFDGKRQAENKFTLEFGIIGVPHMLLIDKQGRLRFDNVSADATDFEQKIESLLRESGQQGS
jgi:peroxiredoxin